MSDQQESGAYKRERRGLLLGISDAMEYIFVFIISVIGTTFALLGSLPIIRRCV